MARPEDHFRMTHAFRPARAVRREARTVVPALAGLLIAVASCAQAPQSDAPTGLEADLAANTIMSDSAISGAPSPFGSYLAGRFARNERDLGAAADFLVRALEIDPDNHDLRAQAFGALVAAGRIEESLPLAEDLVAVDPSAPWPGLVLALTDLRAGNTTGARGHLAELSNSGYNALLVPLIESWLTFAEGDVAAAQGILGSMPDSGGFQAFRALHQGLMYDIGDETAAAEAAYKVAAGAQPGAFRVAQALGGLYERTNRPDLAREVYQAFIDVNPDTPWLEDTMATLGTRPAPAPLIDDAVDGAAEVLFGLANALQGEDESEAALAYARLADHLRPDSDVTALLLGEVFELQGRPAEAIEAYRRVAPESPLAWTARLRVAVSLDDLERSPEAIADLEAMAAERPNRADPWVTIGDLRRGAEQWVEAAAAYDKAIALSGDAAPRHWRLYYARGIALERSTQWPRAEADFLKALELEPDQPYVLNYLGYSWVDKGINLGQALDMIENAVDQRPNDGFIVDSLGWAHYRLGDYREAVRHLERAVELEPNDPTINDHLGDALWHVGRHAEAEFQWRRALSLEPDETLATAIRSKLERGLVAATPSNGDG